MSIHARGFAAACLVLTVATAAEAATFAGQDWQLNGDASLVNGGNTLQLTPELEGQVGSAFITTPLAIDDNTSVSYAFQFRIHGVENDPGDGFAFVLSGDAGAGAGALGNGGSDLGYNGIFPSLVVEFDTFSFGPPNEPDAPQVAIHANGDTFAALASIDSPMPLVRGPADGDLFAWVEFDASTTTLSLFLSDTPTQPGTALLSHDFDDGLGALLGPELWIGFTAGTGAARSFHDINAFSGTTPAPVPLPAAAWLLLSGLGGLGAIARRRRAAPANA